MQSLLPRAAVLASVWLLGTATLSIAGSSSEEPPAPPPPVAQPEQTEEPDRGPLVVPDVRHQPYVYAKGILEDAGFAWEVEGSVEGYAANLVAAQTPEPGKRVVDTGAPTVVLRLERNSSYQQRGLPKSSSSYPGTRVIVWEPKPAEPPPAPAEPAPAAPVPADADATPIVPAAAPAAPEAVDVPAARLTTAPVAPAAPIDVLPKPAPQPAAKSSATDTAAGTTSTATARRAARKTPETTGAQQPKAAARVEPDAAVAAEAKAGTRRKAATKPSPLTTTSARATADSRGAPGLRAAFAAVGAPAEPRGEMRLDARARMVAERIANARVAAPSLVKWWLYQHAWIVAGARYGWSHGEEALRILVRVDQQVQRRWGIGARSERTARVALLYVEHMSR